MLLYMQIIKRLQQAFHMRQSSQDDHDMKDLVKGLMMEMKLKG